MAVDAGVEAGNLGRVERALSLGLQHSLEQRRDYLGGGSSSVAYTQNWTMLKIERRFSIKM